MENRRWRRNLRAGRLLLRNFGSSDAESSRPIRRQTPAGVSYELYEPEGEASSTQIMIYGMDYAGERDVRLVRFAGAYAASGIRAVVPVLPGLKSFQMCPADLDRLIDLTQYLHGQLEKKPRFTGFSAGAGLGLVAAAQPELTKIVDQLLLFSPYYSLAELWQCVKVLESADRQDDRAWESFIMGKMAVAYHQLETLDLTQEQRQQFLYLMQNYCVQIPKVISFYEQVLADRDIGEFSNLMPDAATMEKLSPAGKLGRVNARVLILHDDHDPTSPPNNATRIMAELATRGHTNQDRCLITPLIAHVTARATLRPADALTALDIVGELFS